MKSLNIDTLLALNVEFLYKTSCKVEKVNILKVDSFSKKRNFIGKDFDYLKKTIDQINNIDTKGASRFDKDIINLPEFGIENDFFEIELTPGVFELVDTNNTIKQILSDSDFELNLQADIISMKSVLTNSNNTF